jgi:hypothetical protein
MYLHRGRRGVFFPCIWWKWGVLASCPDPGREMPVLPSTATTICQLASLPYCVWKLLPPVPSTTGDIQVKVH